MPRLIWSAPAVASVQRLYRFLATIDPAAAQRAVAAIRVGVRILGAHPEVGRVVEEMDERFRDWPIDFGGSGYVVRYRFDGELVTILTVRHQREGSFKSD